MTSIKLEHRLPRLSNIVYGMTNVPRKPKFLLCLLFADAGMHLRRVDGTTQVPIIEAIFLQVHFAHNDAFWNNVRFFLFCVFFILDLCFSFFFTSVSKIRLNWSHVIPDGPAAAPRRNNFNQFDGDIRDRGRWFFCATRHQLFEEDFSWDLV